MTWFKIDDSFYDHPKVFDAPDCALALWVRAGTWSARNLTDGFVPTRMPVRLCDDPETAVRELLRRGLWKRAKDGYQFHDWTEYQPTRESVERDREAAAERKRRQRQRGKGQVTDDPVTHMSHRDSRVSPPVTHGVSPPSPTRPDPTLNGGTSGGKESPSARAREEPPQRCPDHLNDPNPPPCGKCADARRAWQTWETNRVRADQARQLAESQARQAARAAPTRPIAAPDAVRRHAAAARAAIRGTTTNQPPKQEDHPEQEQRHAA